MHPSDIFPIFIFLDLYLVSTIIDLATVGNAHVSELHGLHLFSHFYCITSCSR